MPLVEAHAARLEQLDDRWPAEAEAQARMLRAAQALYGLDGVTVGGGGFLAAASCWLAASPGLGIGGAYVAAKARRPLGARPDPPAVAEAASIALASDVLRRVRAVLGDRAAIGYVLPDAARLAAEVGKPAERAWATDVLMELIRTLGADEPEIFLLVGDDEHSPDAREPRGVLRSGADPARTGASGRSDRATTGRSPLRRFARGLVVHDLGGDRSGG